MKTLNALVLALILLNLLPGSSSWACVRIPDGNMSIAGSYKDGRQAYHGNQTDYVFASCNKFVGEYIVLVSAPVYTRPEITKSFAFPDGEFPEEMCSIEHSPFNVSNPADVGIVNFYHAEASLLNTCLEAEVTDARGEIDALSQINCEISQVAKNKVIARGPKCVFKIYENSVFTVHYKMNSDCLNLSFLKQRGDIRPMDVKASLEIYKVPDLTPEHSAIYDKIGVISGRVSLQPDNDLIPVAKYAGTPGTAWPMQYGAQIELGKALLSRTLRVNAEPLVALKTSFFVNNNCAEVCKNGLCTSPCDFAAPVSAHLTFKKKAVGRDLFKALTYWYQGISVPARFLGELSFMHAIPDQDINVGDEYQLLAEFSNPTLSYRTILNEAKQLLIRLTSMLIPTGGAGHKDGLKGLGDLEGTNIVPQNPGLLGLGDLHEGQTQTNSFLYFLNSMVSTDQSWPPYYGSIINGELSDSPSRVFLTLKVGFRVASVAPSGAIVLEKIVYSKESKIFGSYQDKPLTPPEIKCIIGPEAH